MQKSNPPRRIRPQPTELFEITHFLPSPPYMSQEFSQRTTRSWARVRAARKGDNAVIDVDADKSTILRLGVPEKALIQSWTLFAVLVVLRFESSGSGCVGVVQGTRQTFEDDAAAHGDHL